MRYAPISPQEQNVHHWLGRLAMCLAITSHDMPDHLQRHVRKTLDEFFDSEAGNAALTQSLREEIGR